MQPSFSLVADNYWKSAQMKLLVVFQVNYINQCLEINVFLQATFGHQVLVIQQTPGHQYSQPA